MVNKSLTAEVTMLKPALVATTLAASLQAQEGFTERFSSLPPNRWHVAQYDFDHPAFDTDWRRDQVVLRKGLTLQLAPHQNGKNRFAGASVRTHEITQYGRYSILMRPAKGDGIVTGFFTYTGPYYGTRHDEIDIEILGRDTTKLHIAWFNDGKLRQKDITLGFDASTCIHSYEFSWHPKGIEWFVNGQEVFSTAADIPRIPGRIYANIWAADPSISGWAGHAAHDTNATTYIREIRFQPYPIRRPDS